MKRLLSLVCLLGAGLTLWAEHTEAEYQQWMKTVGGTAGGIRKNLEAKNGTAAADDAKKLVEVFGHVEAFWNERKTADAAGFAKEAAAQFKMTSELAAAGKLDEASGALKKAMATCAGCHTAHREKAADGSWKIK